MAKNKNELKIPTLKISTIAQEMAAINEHWLMFKNGIHELFDAVDDGDIEKAKLCMKTFRMREYFSNLNPE